MLRLSSTQPQMVESRIVDLIKKKIQTKLHRIVKPTNSLFVKSTNLAKREDNNIEFVNLRPSTLSGVTCLDVGFLSHPTVLHAVDVGFLSRPTLSTAWIHLTPGLTPHSSWFALFELILSVQAPVPRGLFVLKFMSTAGRFCRRVPKEAFGLPMAIITTICAFVVLRTCVPRVTPASTSVALIPLLLLVMCI